MNNEKIEKFLNKVIEEGRMDNKKTEKFLVNLSSEMNDKISKLKRLEKRIKNILDEWVYDLEKENFKINSSGWKKITNGQKICFLENPEKDIWEYVSGVPTELVGQ